MGQSLIGGDIEGHMTTQMSNVGSESINRPSSIDRFETGRKNLSIDTVSYYERHPITTSMIHMREK